MGLGMFRRHQRETVGESPPQQDSQKEVDKNDADSSIKNDDKRRRPKG